MNAYILLRRLRLPIILLLAGLIALLHQLGVIEHSMHIFLPLALILFGLLMLAERMVLAGTFCPYGVAQVPPPAPQPPSAGPDPAPGTAIVPAPPSALSNENQGGQS